MERVFSRSLFLWVSLVYGPWYEKEPPLHRAPPPPRLSATSTTPVHTITAACTSLRREGGREGGRDTVVSLYNIICYNIIDLLLLSHYRIIVRCLSIVTVSTSLNGFQKRKRFIDGHSHYSWTLLQHWRGAEAQRQGQQQQGSNSSGSSSSSRGGSSSSSNSSRTNHSLTCCGFQRKLTMMIIIAIISEAPRRTAATTIARTGDSVENHAMCWIWTDLRS